MALTPSNLMAIGSPAPNFKLLNTVNSDFESLGQLKGEHGTVILFICNHCPFVIHINETIVRLANEFKPKGINFIAISSNNVVSHPQDGPDYMKANAIKNSYSFPYLYDESQEVAKAYDAACTPDIYLFDRELKLHYHGQIDDSRPGNDIPCTGNHLALAMENLLAGNQALHIQKPSIGCNIKWK